jgi:hypothetical protein
MANWKSGERPESPSVTAAGSEPINSAARPEGASPCRKAGCVRPGREIAFPVVLPQGGSSAAAFMVLPAGNRNNDGTSNNLGNNANFWSSSENDASNAWNRNFNNGNANVNRNNNNKTNGFSLRCSENC